ncbi:MAG: hypothetical protein ACXITV_08155 [Luteibaculaceae bacterium]
MNNFWHRLKFYLIGFTLGIIMVFFFFKERTSVLTSWLPGKRVIWDATYFKHATSETHQCFLACLEINEKLWPEYLEQLKVDFGRSNVREGNKIYHLHARNETFALGTPVNFIKLNMADSLLRIEFVDKTVGNCNCLN